MKSLKYTMSFGLLLLIAGQMQAITSNIFNKFQSVIGIRASCTEIISNQRQTTPFTLSNIPEGGMLSAPSRCLTVPYIISICTGSECTPPTSSSSNNSFSASDDSSDNVYICPIATAAWNGTACVSCSSINPAKPAWNPSTNTCVACSAVNSANPNWNSFTNQCVPACTNGQVWSSTNNVCVCPSSTPLWHTVGPSANTCTVCPSSYPTWNATIGNCQNTTWQYPATPSGNCRKLEVGGYECTVTTTYTGQ